MNLGFKNIVETTAKNIMVLDGNSKDLFSEVLKELHGATVTNIKQVEKNLIEEYLTRYKINFQKMKL